MIWGFRWGTKEKYKGRQPNDLLFADQRQTWNFRDRKWKFSLIYLSFGTECTDVMEGDSANETGLGILYRQQQNLKKLHFLVNCKSYCLTHGREGEIIPNTLRPWQNDVRIPIGVIYVSLFQNIQKSSWARTLSGSLDTGIPSRDWSGRNMRFKTYPFRKRRLRMSGVTHPNSLLCLQQLYGVNFHLRYSETHNGLRKLRWRKKPARLENHLVLLKTHLFRYANVPEHLLR
jgi:hypothetical protein